ncbi:L-xylulose reductase [Sarcoptes scabiei]|uniref:L-xylulose reductase n=1 Tax=Sarcoptes scabiei TaxID=52283 RepID=A0A132A7P1_SARSC|nr:L-xylulose reductase [Sarcoptes scabiei]KPM06991.1 L-xylulose reductase-like protein [Sarcoptes scabiei]UXI23245.1 CAAX prenyl protease 2 [Sarcoptes scabiei]
MEFDFSGKTALVTGASRGIGREIVHLLSTFKCKVIALGRDLNKLTELKENLSNIEIVCIDLSDWSGTKNALQPYRNQIDLLVNNAAYAKCTPLGSIDEKEIDDHYNVNVKAIINVTQCCLDRMKQNRSGSIVNVSSVAGLVGLRDHLVYGGTKASLDLMTKIMALELGSFNIRVNSINPGVTWTEMAMVGWSDEQKRQWMLDRCPLGRFSEPKEIAKAVIFLLSEHSSMINGINLPIDGGVLNTKL